MKYFNFNIKNLFKSCVLFLFLCSCTQEVQKVSIAILVPTSHPSLEENERGFKETIESQYPGKYRFVTFNAQGNKSLMRSEIDEIIRQRFDLVLTVGTTSTQMTYEIFTKKNLKIPIVFSAVNDPSQINGKNVTGVRELLNFDEELAALLKYKPELKKILLVFNPMEPGLQKDQQQIARILREKDIDLLTVETFQSNEIKLKVSPFIQLVDAVVVLKDNTVVSGLDALIKLCDQYHIPLMASDLDSPDRGAAFGYGVYEIDFGVEAAKKAIQILEHELLPFEIPVTPVLNFALRINKQAALRQGIEVSLLPEDVKGVKG
jgi:putative ABC transport system substrate-binding protein